MADESGQDSGHAAGFTWGDLLAALIEEHGTLSAVAWRLVEQAPGDDVASIERALRRLRRRGQLDGGVWGQRLLRVFGVPATVESRVRWMGLYHSPFGDLPLPLCLDQLRLWDRPPVSTSRARVWLHLGHASCALRARALDDAAAQLTRATAALAGLAGHDDARVELALIEAYVASQRGEPVHAALAAAERTLASGTLAAVDAACFRARLVDQRAYQLNRAGDHAAALALFESLPADDVHPFASYRRDAGRAFGCFRAGRREEALALAWRACEHAGDGGYTRLRAMGLLLVARVQDGPAGAAARARARAIALRLDDGELLARVERQEQASRGGS
ncbi:hypothetical protein [Nannocystis radixulma]|uniref:XRE family transcriptional regulator n=1 Tax=Nannocystis radixulma TaxID=2995305 RepID=A0ABT5BFR2_9BACT|nr:hypothetical protein [Nannocystis radixulma]MDC0672973.1 hypothetical protein [Nannocystis radixulma]